VVRYNRPMAELALRSAAFEDGQPIPSRHTCEGEDVSPALDWTSPPAGTRSLALVVEDPDAPGGTFTHWLAWGIEPGALGLAEGGHPPMEPRKVDEAVRGHVLGAAELIGTFER
jgi:phosphatidylethanolamine-binding protein (PEBP) family uncharacterized protein